MSVPAPHGIAPRIFQAMHRSRSFYFAASAPRLTRDTTNSRSAILQMGANCAAAFPASIRDAEEKERNSAEQELKRSTILMPASRIENKATPVK
ncbi:hypothetical protein [Bradyrhizobium sp. LTSPM299]|uniref:hypothetical protein n=1 Tax=Bradyrhizobium sp. LTSPM299 TaxID=1619233 RepID=UPI0012E30B5D|nr:hypothetical protein [Bradyrhizobium sp. LTSPM299]